MKILCLISTFERGGAERVIVWLCKKLIASGHNATLACFAPDNHRDITNLPYDVPVVHLNQLGSSGSPIKAIQANIKRLISVRNLYQKYQPEIVISFLDKTNVVALAASFGFPFPVVVAEHTDPSRSQLGLFWSLGRRLLYPYAKRLLLLAEGMRTFFPASFQERIRIMPNPLLMPADSQRAEVIPGRKRLLAVGRLHPVKAYDSLIRAFASLADAYPEWDLAIVGEGPERVTLEAEVARYHMERRITLPGDQLGPFAFYRTSDAFVLTSHREGFPLVLVEALASGLPILAVDCSPALSEIFDKGQGGIIVPNHDAHALEAGLRQLMGDDNLRQKLMKESVSLSLRYTPDRIFKKWEHLIEDVTT